MQETWVQSLGWEDPVEKEMARYSCLGNPVDRETWWAIVYEVAKDMTWQLNRNKYSSSSANSDFVLFVSAFL